MSIKNDFPILASGACIYLDSASTTQKPAHVIRRVAEYLETGYANIHRGAYSLSEISEELYRASKIAVAKRIGAESPHEVVYTANATASYNLLAQSLAYSGVISRGDRVVLSLLEHHANIVPWLMLKNTLWIEVEFVGITSDFGLDMADLEAKLTPNTRVVSLTGASNVTGTMPDWTTIRKLVRAHTSAYLIMDASQRIAHVPLEVQAWDIDFMVATGHKIWADPWIGILYGKKHLLKTLTPSIWGGGAINFVRTDSFEPAGLPFRFEPGTPNMTGAVSLLAACEYLEHIGWYAQVAAQENPIIAYALEEFNRRPFLTLIGPKAEKSWEVRTGVFSFTVSGWHGNDVADFLAEKNICVRSGHHCTEPLHQALGLSGTVRMSIGIYTTQQDVEVFFSALDEAFYHI